MDHARGLGRPRFHLTAQTTVVALYRDLDFEEFGDEFLDAGIPHLAMKTY